MDDSLQIESNHSQGLVALIPIVMNLGFITSLGGNWRGIGELDRKRWEEVRENKIERKRKREIREKLEGD